MPGYGIRTLCHLVGNDSAFQTRKPTRKQAGGRRQERESSRSGADDTASARHGTSAGCCAADTELSGFVSGGQHNPPLRTNTVTPRPTLTVLSLARRRPEVRRPRRADADSPGAAADCRCPRRVRASLLFGYTLQCGVDRILCMRTFVQVAERRSFSRAAAALGLSRATVSTHISQLEAHLRCALLERSTRRVAPTAAGAEYLKRSRAILEDLAAADLAAQRASSGT
jgi:hypothetical protein